MFNDQTRRWADELPLHVLLSLSRRPNAQAHFTSFSPIEKQSCSQAPAKQEWKYTKQFASSRVQCIVFLSGSN